MLPLPAEPVGHVAIRQTTPLEDTKVPKIGLSLRDDLNSLHKLDDFQSGYFIDLQDHVREIGVEDMSLQKLYANFFGQRISKREQLDKLGGRHSERQAEGLCGYRCLDLHSAL